MTNDQELVVPMSDAMRQLTVTVRVSGQRVAMVRLKAGTWLIRLAAVVMGCNVELYTDGEGAQALRESAQ